MIAFFQIIPQEKRLYQLKDKSLERQAKGYVVMTFDLIYNPIRASLRTFNPREVNALFEPPRFRRQVRGLLICQIHLIFCLISINVTSYIIHRYIFRKSELRIFLYFNKHRLEYETSNNSQAAPSRTLNECLRRKNKNSWLHFSIQF